MRKLKLFMVLAVSFMFLAGSAYGGDDAISRYLAFDAAVANTVTAYSSIIDLSAHKPAGFFTAYVNVTGAGSNVTLKYQIYDSLIGAWTTPSGAADICTTFAANGGPATDGIDAFSFSPIMCDQMRISATAAGANITDLEVVIFFQ